MIHQTNTILSLLSKKLRIRYYIITAVSIFSPFLDVFSISMLIPILTDVASGGSSRTAALRLMLLGLLMAGKGLYELFLVKIQASWECDCNWMLATKMYDLMLQEDLSHHNLKNESLVLHDVRQDVGTTIMALTYIKDAILNTILLAGYMLLVCILSGITGLFVILALGALMLLLRKTNRKKVLFYGSEVRKREIGLVDLTVSTYHAFKEIAIDERKSAVTDKFSNVAKEKESITKSYLIQQSFVSIILQNLTNAVIFILLALILLTGFDISKLISMALLLITVLAKMIPASKNVLLNWNRINYDKNGIENTINNCHRYQAVMEEKQRSLKERYRPVSLEKKLSVRHLTYAYQDGSVILNNVDMEIPAGKITAVVGASGEGKTTLLDLIVGLLKPRQGEIWYDDYDIVNSRDSAGACRTNVGEIVSYMPQIPTYHEGTVKDCVSFIGAEASADEDRVIKCLKTAMLYEEVSKMPRGIDTVIGPAGIRLSGGQYQRLGLARALYKDFQLLVMDEATSSQGAETEEAIFHAIQNGLKGKTVLLATHHENLALQCDVIYEVKDSVIIRRK